MHRHPGEIGSHSILSTLPSVLSAPAGELPCPVLQIHGSRDRILPHRQTRPDVLISGGGHLINVTHSAEVNDFLSVNMERLGELDEPT